MEPTGPANPTFWKALLFSRPAKVIEERKPAIGFKKEKTRPPSWPTRKAKTYWIWIYVKNADAFASFA